MTTVPSRAAPDVLAAAERAVFREKLRILEQSAVQRLSHRRGLALTSLWAPSDVILVACLDGVHVGRVRLEGPHGGHEKWYAVPLRPWRPHGPYPSALDAAQALASQHREADGSVRCRRERRSARTAAAIQDGSR